VPDRDPSVPAEVCFEDVYAEHVAFVWRTLRGMGLPPATVPDAAQDVFVVVHRKLADFDGRYGLRTWLFQIVYRVVCEYRRKGRRGGMQEPLDEGLRDASPGPAEMLERHEASAVLFELLAGLDDAKRAVILLSEIEEMTAPEIAVATNTPLNTVYTRLRRARSELNAAMDVRRRGAR
jgi:RNA polymerase sigma-70 factor (ECF subfamily)